MIGSLGPVLTVLQTILPVALTATFPTSKTRSVKKLSRSFFLSPDLQRLSPILSTWVRSIEHSSTMEDWFSLRQIMSFRAVFRSALYLSKLPLCRSPHSWNAFAIACWSTIKLATISSTPLILFLSSSFSLVTASRYKDRSLVLTTTSKDKTRQPWSSPPRAWSTSFPLGPRSTSLPLSPRPLACHSSALGNCHQPKKTVGRWV